MSSASTPDYPVGSNVFAKLKGFPWWPARVEDEKTVPSKVLKQKTKSKGPIWTVWFFGSRDYGFFGPEQMRPFNAEAVRKDLEAKKFKSKELEQAVRQALDPSKVTMPEDKVRDEDEEEDEEEEEDVIEEQDDDQEADANEDDEQEEEEMPKPKKKLTQRAKASSTKTASAKATADKRKKKTVIEDDDDKDEKITKKAKKSRVMDDEEDEGPTNGKRQNGNEDKKKKPRSSSNTTAKGSPTPSAHDNLSPESRKVMDLRRRLQVLVYHSKDKKKEVPKDAYPKIDAVLKEIENLDVTLDQLRETKIGKVMKLVCITEFPDDEYNIVERASNVMKRWKVVIGGQSKDDNETKVDEGTKPSEGANETDVDMKEADISKDIEPVTTMQPSQSHTSEPVAPSSVNTAVSAAPNLSEPVTTETKAESLKTQPMAMEGIESHALPSDPAATNLDSFASYVDSKVTEPQKTVESKPLEPSQIFTSDALGGSDALFPLANPPLEGAMDGNGSAMQQ